MKKNFLLKLAKMMMKFGEIETDKGVLTYEGELAEGTEVFIEVDGELVPAEDGEYQVEDKIYVVEGGKVTQIKEVEVEEPEGNEPEEPENIENEIDQPAEDVEALKAKIAELEAIIIERDARIAELGAQLAEKEEQLQMSVAKPAHKEVKDIVITNKENKALRFFK